MAYVNEVIEFHKVVYSAVSLFDTKANKLGPKADL